jgi:hypothetical protein
MVNMLIMITINNKNNSINNKESCYNYAGTFLPVIHRMVPAASPTEKANILLWESSFSKGNL